METKSALDLIDKDGWFIEKNNQWPGMSTAVKVRRILFYKQSKFQEVMIFESEKFGNILVLDGVIQLTQKHEFIYHEMMCHTSFFAHPKPQNILVIGAGDGGVIREMCKHEMVERIVWIEIDEDVIKSSEIFLPTIATSNKDPRVSIQILDGYKYVRESKENSFDIIMCDSSDPIGPAKMLFTKQFYSDCYRILKPGGILVSQSECIFQNADLISELVKNSREIFKNGSVHYSSFYTPGYPFGQLGGLFCRKYCPELDRKGLLDVRKPVRKIPKEIKDTLRYYSEEIHSSAFVLPKFMQSKL